MTVAALAPSVEYLEDGITLDFPVPFRFEDPANLRAIRVLVDGTVSELAYGAEWTATGGDTDAGGTLHLLATVAGASLSIRRYTMRAQQIDYQTLDLFPAETHERGLDRGILIDQEQDVQIGDLAARSMLLPAGDVAPPLGPLADYLAGDTLVVREDGHLRWHDRATFAGKFFAGDATGGLIPASGTGNDAALRGDLANPALGGALIAYQRAGGVVRSGNNKWDDLPHFFDFVPGTLHAGIIAGTNFDDFTDLLNAAFALNPLMRMPTIGTFNILGSLLIPSGGGIIGGGGRSIIRSLDHREQIPLIRNANYLPASAAERDKGLVFRDFKIDGNKANNTNPLPVPPNAQYEYLHGIQLNAVDGVDLNVWVTNCQGDGVIFAYARGLGDGAPSDYGLGCRGMRGFIRSDDCYRQGVAMTCAEEFNLAIFALRSGYYGFDIEPDQTASYVRDGFVRVLAKDCGLNANGGGVAVGGTNTNSTGAADVRDIMCEVLIRDCTGIGISTRDISNVSFRGELINAGATGFASGLGAFGPSNISVDLTITGSTGAAVSIRKAGTVVNGKFWTVGGAANLFEGCAGGRVQFRSANSTQQGLTLMDSSDMVFPDCEIINAASHGVFLRKSSSHNRFPNLRVAPGAGTGAFAWGILEETGGTFTGGDNKATNARIAGGASAGAVSFQSASSSATGEMLGIRSAYDPLSVANNAGASTILAVAGAAYSDDATCAFSASMLGLIKSASVNTSNNVTISWFNATGAAVDPSAGYFEAFVQPKAAGIGGVLVVDF